MRTETVEMDRGERVEMVVAIYDSADTVRRRDFGTHAERQQPLQHIGSTSVNNKKHRAAEVCLCLLCFLLLIAVIVLCVCFTTERHQLLTYISNLIEERVQVMEHNNNLTQEREQILTKHEQTLNHNNNLTKERQQVFTNNTKLTAEKERLLKENKILTEKREQIKNEINELKRGLLEQDQRTDNFKWIYYNFSFYYISSEKKGWIDSSQDCQQRGADLAIINSQKEQDFLQKIAVYEDFWIGLRKIQGLWKWTGGATMTNRYWRSQYPRLYGYCVLITSTGWVDDSCTNYKKWICKRRILQSLHDINMYTS
ncbi:CD209 antigen [Labeo rohita]|uniref:CD209 antigen n=1 Tax=Labeo rohita TaxID=84645 RepID=UPI0021E33020|nr:CD209 antigen [Labeo rohita]